MNRSFARGRLGAVALAVAGATFLGGCAPLLIGAAVAGGAMVYTDRRSSGTQLEDEVIEVKGMNRATEMFGERAHINVTSYNRIVLLTGEVPAEADKGTFQQSISKIENVQSVVNELILGPPRSMSGRSNDALPGRARYSTSAVIAVEAKWRSKHSRIAGPEDSAGKRRSTHASSQCICTHECQSKLPWNAGCSSRGGRTSAARVRT